MCDRITAGDLIAVQMLSVPVPAEVAIALLDGRLGNDFFPCLADIDTAIKLGTSAAAT